ncbi:hypothetical protein M0P65_04130 [Candidatus Gracilibacteria bacterium]|nr:hypothetical protein [Candidatus Gracilibacteria bacterium]
MVKLKQNNDVQNLRQFALKISNGNKTISDKVAHVKAKVQEIEETPELRKEAEKYRNILLSYKKELYKIGLIEIDGIWYFDECVGWRKWQKIGKIGNKYLSSFPSSGWNKKRGIGIVNIGSIQNKMDLKKMFKSLGIRVATEEQELERYKNILLSHRNELEEIGLIEINNIWYFFECIQWKNWPKIGKKHLSSFPNATLNKKWGAGNKVGTVQDDKGLKIMLEGLGINTATEEQELERYKNLLMSHKEELFKIGLQEIEGIWYFNKCIGNQEQNWPKIGNKYLGSLIKAEFMREKGIGRADKGDVVNKTQLKEMFRLLNIPVATARQEIEQMQKEKNAKNDNNRRERKKGEKKTSLNTNKEVIDENFRDEFQRFIKRKITSLNKGDYSLSLELDYLMRLPDISKNVFLEFIEGLPEDDRNEIKEIYPTNEKILGRIDCFVEDRIKNLK